MSLNFVGGVRIVELTPKCPVLCQIWERMGGVQVATPPADDPDAAALRAAVDGGPTPSRVGFIGLGSMGQGMAAALTCSGMRVCGTDVGRGGGGGRG